MLEKDILVSLVGGAVLTVLAGLVDLIITPRPTWIDLITTYLISVLLVLYILRERREG